MRPSHVALLLIALGAGSADAVRCAASKLKETGKATTRLLECHRRAALLGAPVNPSCLDKARGRLAAAFADADARGGCGVENDAAAVAAEVDAFVSATVDAAPTDGPRCTGTTLHAMARHAGALLKTYRSVELRGDYARLVDFRTRAPKALGVALAGAPCTTPPDPAAFAASAAAFGEDVGGALLCGDGIRQLGEVCDGADDAACPAACAADCTCRAVAPFACLGGSGPGVTLSGTHAAAYDEPGLAAATRIDARAATFLGSTANPYPVNLGGGDGICLAGGKVAGQYDRGATWEWMHDHNNAGVRFENARSTLDGVRIDDVTDGIRPVGGAFLIRHAWLSYVRDDCIENDHVQAGLVFDSLLDGCYVAVSERPSPDILDNGANGRHSVLTIRGSLVRLQAMPGPADGSATAFGHGQFFKWHERASALALHDSVFLAEQVAESGADSMGVPESLVSCANNVMVWLGAGPYPAHLPPCFTVTHDRVVWDDAVAAWQQRHPEVAR